MTVYSHSYYRHQETGSLRSAREIVPLVVELIQPRSVIDVGCGIGTWASVFAEHGVEEVWGVDGDYVDRSLLRIPSERFIAFDLAQPLVLERTFELAVCLEVAEHLPPGTSKLFVDSLVRLSPRVLFSAATPFQGGTNHVNERWQDEWAELFEERDYVALDCVRPRVWRNDSVVWFYAQNVIFYVRRDIAEGTPSLAQCAAHTRREQLALLHPKAVTSLSVRSLVRLLAMRVVKSSKRRLVRRARRST